MRPKMHCDEGGDRDAPRIAVARIAELRVVIPPAPPPLIATVTRACYRFAAHMTDLDTLLRWAQMDQTEARFDAAYQLRKHAGVPGALPVLVQMLADPDAKVASQAFASIVLGHMCTPDICVTGLASPHSI